MSKKKGKPETSPDPKSEKKSDTEIPSRTKVLSWAVFIPTLVVTFISLISVVFPALITRTTSLLPQNIQSSDIVNAFELGFLAFPLIGINLIILAIGIAYYKRSKGVRFIKSISSFELSKKRALIAVIVLLAIFCAITAGTLGKEETWADYGPVKERLQSWTISDFAHGFEPHFRYLLLSASLHIFGNIRVIPFITSMALLILTYFFTINITQKRFAGVISMAIVLQSDIFTSYSTTASYDNIWILLYLFSLYLIERFWYPSPGPYLLSIFSKALTAVFLPMSLYFIARSTLTKRARIFSLASYGIIGIVLLGAVTVLKTNLVGTTLGFSSIHFWQGFSTMTLQMRFDYVVVLFLLPLVVMLFFATRRGILHADSIMIFILVLLLIPSLLIGITHQTNEPYRFVPLVVFFAIGVGVLFSNRTRTKVEL